MSQAPTQLDGLDIRRVVETTGAVLRRNLQLFMPWALLLIALPLALIGAAGEPADGHPGGALFGLVLLVTSLFYQVAVVRTVAADFEGAPVAMREGLAAARGLFWPLLGLVILFGLAVALGFVLLVVPGVMLAVAWAVVMQVLIIERPPILQTFGRSAQLTRGARWSIFGLGLILLGLELAGGLAAAMLGFALPHVVGRVILAPLLNAAITTVAAAGATVLYLELRQREEDRAAAGSIGVSA